MSHEDDEQTNVALRRRNHKINKNELEGWFWIKNYHSSLVDEGETTKVLMTAYKRERENNNSYI